MNEERVESLLDDVLGSDRTELTQADVEEAGGREAVIAMVLQ